MKERNMLTATFGNNWGGRRGQALIDYMVQQAQQTDVFALTEVNHLPGADPKVPVYMTNPSDKKTGHDQIMLNQFEVLRSELLWSHAGHFAGENSETYKCATGKQYPCTQYGNAMFSRIGLNVIETGSVFILGNFNQRAENGSSPRVMQYKVIFKDGQWYLIAHFHGVWYKDPDTGSTKSDGPVRIKQSANVLTALEKIAVKYAISKVIFGGDFNLDIDTVALRMLEQGSAAGLMGYRNLIRERNITDTRTALYRDYTTPGTSLYADYVFVSESVRVEDIQLVGQHASDHAHIQINFS